MKTAAESPGRSGRRGVPWRSRTLLAILASTAALPLGVPMLSPVLPAIGEHFGIGDPSASLVFTIYFLPAVLLSPLIGMFVDRVGRRRVLVPMLASWGVAGLLVAFAPSFEVTLLARFRAGHRGRVGVHRDGHPDR